ncbi:MAG: TrbI/VirB10 family protein [Smithella sp.]
MSKYQDIKKSIQKMIHKRSDEQSSQIKADEEISNVSMTEGRKPKVFGINRKIIYGLVGILLVSFIGSLYFNMTDKPDAAKTKKTTETATKAVNNRAPIQDSFPDDYGGVGRLAGYDAQKTGRTSTVNANSRAANRTVPAASSETVITVPANTASAASLPPITARNYAQSYPPSYSAPYPTYSYPVSQTTAAPSAPQATTAAAETMKENFKAAIRFALGKTDTEQTGQTTANAQPAAAKTTSQATPAVLGSSSYTEASPNILQAGTLIPAMLLTGINSDIGGQVIAQVESDVYDSLYGSTLLIPAGSRLIGQYSAGAANGQNRVNITWGTLVLPNGGSYALGNSMIAVDGAGYAGLEGNVNNHTGQVLSAAGFTSALAALGSIAAGNTGTTDSNYSAGQLAAQGAMGNLLNTASSMLQKNLNIAPTITINPGYGFNIFVSQQISFNPY